MWCENGSRCMWCETRGARMAYNERPLTYGDLDLNRLITKEKTFRVNKLPKEVMYRLNARFGLKSELLLLECTNPLSIEDYWLHNADASHFERVNKLMKRTMGLQLEDVLHQADLLNNADAHKFVDKTVYIEFLNSQNYFKLPLQMFPELIEMFRIYLLAYKC